MSLFKNEEFNKKSINYSDPYADIILAKHITSLISCYNYKKWFIVCVGTDRSTGDSLGPLVGTRLKLHEYQDFLIIGTLDEPIHALNLVETIEYIKAYHSDFGIIAIDASLGQLSSVGCIQILNGPLKPGAGVKKDLPEIGDFHITGIVNVGGFMEYFVLQNTRLSVVMRMSEIISSALISIINKRKVQIKKESAIDQIS